MIGDPKARAVQLVDERVPYRRVADMTALTVGQVARAVADARGREHQEPAQFHVRYCGDWDRFLFEPYAERKKRLRAA